MSDDHPSTPTAGIHGMNVENIPIARVPFGYFIAPAIVIGLVLGRIRFFYRRGRFG